MLKKVLEKVEARLSACAIDSFDCQKPSSTVKVSSDANDAIMRRLS